MTAPEHGSGAAPETLLLRGGVIRTMDPANPISGSLLVDGSTVAAVDLEPAGATTTVDLAGRCVVPGFTDSHVHFTMWSLAQQHVRLEGCRDVGEALERVRVAVERRSNGGWLMGYGWRSLDWTTPEDPNRWDLDRVSGSIPVALRSKDGHSIWLNSAALSVAAGDLRADGGVVVLDDHGQPTGVLKEECAWRFEERHVRASEADRIAAVRDGIRIANSRGLTAIHDKDGGMGALGTWQQLRQADELSLRVWQSFPARELEALEQLGLRSGLGDELLRVGYLKAFMDGSLGSRTAHRLDGSGVSVMDAAELEDLLRRASRGGWPVAVHAIGDRANRDALDAFESTRHEWEPRGLRQRIEHAQLVHPDDIPRFARLGVACSVQFSHAPSDRDLVEREWADAAEHAYPFRSLWDAGALVINGSDAPIEELDPLMGIRAATARTLDGRPPWRPIQALSVQEALEASTVNPVQVTADEGRRGRLAPGQVADLVVLDRDPVTCPAEELGDLRVLAAMVGGRWVFGPPPGD